MYDNICPLAPDQSLMVFKLALTVNGNSVGINSALAAIDTGTTLLGGPSDSVTDFWNQVSGSRSIGQGMYSYRTHLRLSHEDSSSLTVSTYFKRVAPP